MNDFVLAHQSQLQALNIPASLYEGLWKELEASFDATDGSLTKEEALTATPGSLLVESKYIARFTPTENGKMLVILHLCSWDIVENPSRGLWDALRALPIDALQQVHQGLVEQFCDEDGKCKNDNSNNSVVLEEDMIGEGSRSSITGSKEDGERQEQVRKMLLMDYICNHCWAHVILYRCGAGVRAALPSPPFFPLVSSDNEADPNDEADVTGPFPFQYQLPNGSAIIVDTSLVYLSPDFCCCLTDASPVENGGGCGSTSHSPRHRRRLRLPTLDLVPPHSVSNVTTRAVRYAALFGNTKHAPPTSVAKTKELYANFAHRMHLVRQQKLSQQARPQVACTGDVADEYPLPLRNGEESSHHHHHHHHHHQNGDDHHKRRIVLKVYTDHGDPLQLAHPRAGLNPAHYSMTNSMHDADIIFSYGSLFAPGATRELIETRWSSSSKEGAVPLINQFPFEGAMVSKDHLASGILQQHGLPLPSWALESYDLDVNLAEFVGSALLAKERGEDPIWIVKPARLTQSRGHVVTRSTAQVLRLLDAGGGSRVAQRYIQNPVTYDGRKVDCRCLVMMVSATKGNPILFMHKRVYFRIANKEHCISSPGAIFDNETVLTATHLLDESRRTTTEALRALPVDYKTIAKLEEDYPGQFDWENEILPKIHTLVRELFAGMTAAYPAMEKSVHSRAIYGIDIMFEIDDSSIDPRLTEVTFCPANNAICDGYERDEELYKSYNTEVFDCLFRSVVSENITVLNP